MLRASRGLLPTRVSVREALAACVRVGLTELARGSNGRVAATADGRSIKQQPYPLAVMPVTQRAHC